MQYSLMNVRENVMILKYTYLLALDLFLSTEDRNGLVKLKHANDCKTLRATTQEKGVCIWPLRNLSCLYVIV